MSNPKKVLFSLMVLITLLNLAMIYRSMAEIHIEEVFEPLIMDRSNYKDWVLMDVDDRQFLLEGDYNTIHPDGIRQLLLDYPRLKRSNTLVLRIKDGRILTVDVYEEKMQDSDRI